MRTTSDCRWWILAWSEANPTQSEPLYSMVGDNYSPCWLDAVLFVVEVFDPKIAPCRSSGGSILIRWVKLSGKEQAKAIVPSYIKQSSRQSVRLLWSRCAKWLYSLKMNWLTTWLIAQQNDETKLNLLTERESRRFAESLT